VLERQASAPSRLPNTDPAGDDWVHTPSTRRCAGEGAVGVSASTGRGGTVIKRAGILAGPFVCCGG